MFTCCRHSLELGPGTGTGFQVGGTAHQHHLPPVDATVDELFPAGTSGSFQSSSRDLQSQAVQGRSWNQEPSRLIDTTEELGAGSPVARVHL